MRKMNFALESPVPVYATDAFGDEWLPALLLEIRNGVALVQIGDYQTVRSLAEVCQVSHESDPGKGGGRRDLSRPGVFFHPILEPPRPAFPPLPSPTDARSSATA
jgi:hypothetical protein